MTVRPLSLALMLASAACSVPRTGMPPEQPTLPVSVTPTAELPAQLPPYQLWNADRTGLAEVTDDGVRTQLRFAGPPPTGLMLFDQAGKPVSYHAQGNSLVVDELRSGWLIRTSAQASYAQASARRGAAEEENAPTVRSASPSLAAVHAQLDTLATRLKSIDAELADPLSSSPTVKSELDEIATELDGVQASLLRAHFASGSAVLALSADAQDALLKAARAASAVSVRGATDSTGSIVFNQHLALERAIAVKQVLIEGGIQEEKITMSATATEFIASNATRAGRALNRRVDVVLRPETGEPVKIVMQTRAD